MKNRILLFIFFVYFFLFNFSYSEIIKFESPELKILDSGNKITANNGVRIESDDGIIINADKAIYNKKDNILNVSGNIKIKDNIQNLKFTSNKIIYLKNSDKIKIVGESKASIKDKYSIISQNLVYDRKKMEIFSEGIIEIKDELGNKIKGKNLKFNINKNIVKGKNLKIYDNEKNEFLLKNGIVNLTSKEFIGKDAEVSFKNSLFGNEDNEPRIKGKSLIAKKEKTNVYKGVFTTCKKNEKNTCPAWAVYADEVEHIKQKKIINYKNAWLKIYDVPVIYFPKFYHPDPTVKRQSGFLFPTIKSSSLYGQSIQIPYFKVISDNKDLTISPRLYFDNNIFVQNEYRQVNKNSNIISDFSVQKKDTTKTHLFTNITKNFNNSSKIEFNLEKVSNDNYLKLNDIESPIIKNKSKLYSYINYNKNEDDYYFTSSIGVYEDLGKVKSDRYEYIYPQYSFYKEIDYTDENSKVNLTLTSDGYQKNYDTNISEKVIINDLLFDSNMKSFDNGITNKYKFLLRNINTSADNSNNYQNDTNLKLLSTFIFESEYPLLKKSETYYNFLIPKLSYRYSPNVTKKSKKKEARLNFNNIFDIDRAGQSDLVESNQSLTFGIEYEKINKLNNTSFLSLGLATVFRDKRNFDLPKETTLGQKTSDVVGYFNLKPSKFFDIGYEFSLDNNLNQVNYNNINTNIKINNFVTSFEYLEENKHFGENSYLKNKTTYKLNNNKSIAFATSKDLKKDLTEYYKLIYEYQNDCLIASIEYDKEYYSDGDLKPEENILFMIKIKSFGEITSIPITKQN